MPFTFRTRACLLLLFALGCSHPEPSRKPLGMGPLALAEQTKASEQQTAKRELRLAQIAEERETTRPEPVRPAESKRHVADGGSSPPADAGVELTDGGVTPTLEAWLGLYQGHDVTRYVMEGQPERSFDDPKAKIRVERLGKSQLHFIFVDSSNGQDLCTLLGDVTGDEAKLPEGQRCFIEPDEDMTVSSRPAVAKLAGRQLTLNLVLDTTLALEEQQTEGKIEYEFNGQRL